MSRPAPPSSRLARVICCAGLCAGALTFTPDPVRAADQSFEFHIPAKPLRQALVDFALQANVSIGSAGADRCAPAGRPVDGRYTAKAALSKLLAGSGCTFRRLDPHAYEIVPTQAPPWMAPLRAARREPPPPVATPPSPSVAGEVVIVATRRASRADKLAYPVSAIDGETLQTQHLVDLTDLSMVTPAMTVTNLGLGRDKIFLRGLSDGPLTGQTQSMIGLYFDDVRLTYNAPNPDLRLVDIDRVEIVRGPQGALYGSGSMGGVVQIVSAQPDPNGYAGSITAEADGTERFGDSWAVDAVVNAPLLDGRGAARFVAYDEARGGYINDVGLGLPDVNRSYREGGRAAFKFDLDEHWTIDFGGLDQEIKADDTQYALAGLPPYARRNFLQEPYDNDFGEAHLGVHGDLSFGDLSASLAYIGHGLSSRFDATDAPPVPTPAGPSAFDERDDIRSLVGELTLSSKSDAWAQWMAGAFVAGTKQNTVQTLTALDAPAPLALDDRRADRLVEAALFGDVVVKLTSKLDLTLGGRVFTSHNTVVSLGREPLAGVSAAFSGAEDRTGFAPKVVLAYHPGDGVLFYTEIAEGYRSGGFNAGAPNQAFGASGVPSRAYDGDELWNVEAGARIALYDDRLWFRAAVFEDFWKNVQSDQLLPSGLPFTVNLGDGTDQGLEFEGRYRQGAFELHAQFLLDEPELAHHNAIFPGADFGLAGVPNQSAGVDGRYRWPLFKDRSIEFDIRAQYVGPSQLTLDPGIARRMGGYADGRVALSLLDPHWRVTLAVDNPANSRGNTFAFGNPFTARIDDQLTPLRPRTVSLQIGASFP